MILLLLLLLGAAVCSEIVLQQELDDVLAARAECLANADPGDECTTVEYVLDDGTAGACQYTMNTQCIYDRNGLALCEKHVASMNDPCIELVRFDSEMVECVLQRRHDCEVQAVAESMVESLWNAVRAQFKHTD